MEAVQITNLSPLELSRLIKNEVMEFVKPKEEEEELLTQKEVAGFYKVSVQTIIKWQKDGIIKAYAIGNERRYKKSELIKNLILIK
ncbi:helix-turn-helix domain-containing protein [Flavobacterium sp. TP390]|uniref:Helix-turn-helix domain-containing protein n=1 Tax=Flavobacterium profundi TaxID=1774945 RepID=A0A6I4IST3_9FLAO|nr:helix-turn-helix domain-containing protein [Flavobacterium profundi]MVO09777.1 helix-turn-helix domain-containing protein [Flavobacterium profundi]